MIPTTEQQLLDQAQSLAGLTLGQVAETLHWNIPASILHAKGWVGQLIEAALGAESGSLSQPDFPEFGIELKTLPILPGGIPAETTYVCTVPLTKMSEASWRLSTVYAKLSHVLWIPIEAAPTITLSKRRIGMPMLWDLLPEDETVLKKDWEEFAELIALGQVNSITAHQGTYLQIRPKAAHSRIKTAGIGVEGERIQTLPRGFYLRKVFTQRIIKQHFVV